MTWMICKSLLVIGMALIANAHAFSQALVSTRHLMILRPGIDAVYGTYMFAVNNAGESDANLNMRLMLPKETVDFSPVEGLLPKDMTLGDGGIFINKDFPKGNQVLNIGFKVDGSFGASEFLLNPNMPIASFTILIDKDSGLVISTPDLKSNPHGGPDHKYIAYENTAPLQEGQLLTINVQGIPEGRGLLWIFGAVTIFIILLGAALLTLRTRPRFEEKGDSLVLLD
jgi:hypothetical protein